MDFWEKEDKQEKAGKFVGYISSYLVFTIGLFFILTILKKLPSSWGYFHLAVFALLIPLLGEGLKKALK